MRKIDALSNSVLTATMLLNACAPARASETPKPGEAGSGGLATETAEVASPSGFETPVPGKAEFESEIGARYVEMTETRMAELNQEFLNGDVVGYQKATDASDGQEKFMLINVPNEERGRFDLMTGYEMKLNDQGGTTASEMLVMEAGGVYYLARKNETGISINLELRDPSGLVQWGVYRDNDGVYPITQPSVGQGVFVPWMTATLDSEGKITGSWVYSPSDNKLHYLDQWETHFKNASPLPASTLFEQANVLVDENGSYEYDRDGLEAPTLTFENGMVVTWDGTKWVTESSQVPEEIRQAQENLGPDYKLVAKADGSGYEVQVVATGEMLENLALVDHVYYYEFGGFKYAVAEEGVKGGQAGDGRYELGVWSVDEKTGAMEVHTVGAEELKASQENVPTMGIRFETDASGFITESTWAQLKTMNRARDEAMKDGKRDKEVANALIPDTWRIYDGSKYGMAGSLGFIPVADGSSDGFEAKRRERWPMPPALESGMFGVQIFDGQGQMMQDLLHVSVVALNEQNEEKTNNMAANSAWIPKSELPRFFEYATAEKRGTLNIVLVKNPKITYASGFVEGQMFSDEPLRELMARINWEFFRSFEAPSGANKFVKYQVLPGEFRSLIFDVKDMTGMSGFGY